MHRTLPMMFALLVIGAAPLTANEATPPRLPVISALHEDFATLRGGYAEFTIDGTALSDGSIVVSIMESSGSVVFESNYPIVRDGAKYLEWAYRPIPTTSRSVLVTQAMFPTLDGMAVAAKNIVRMLRSGRTPPPPGEDVTSQQQRFSPSPLDNWGCDAPFDALSCTPKGNCCDTHDDCYATWNCDAISWLGIGSLLCVACDTAAAACILSGVGDNGQPSLCCTLMNCGLPRAVTPPGNPPSDPGDGNNLEQQLPGYSYGGGGGWQYTPYGYVYTSNGTCKFPDGRILPCG